MKCSSRERVLCLFILSIANVLGGTGDFASTLRAGDDIYTSVNLSAPFVYYTAVQDTLFVSYIYVEVEEYKIHSALAYKITQ